MLYRCGHLLDAASALLANPAAKVAENFRAPDLAAVSNWAGSLGDSWVIALMKENNSKEEPSNLLEINDNILMWFHN